VGKNFRVKISVMAIVELLNTNTLIRSFASDFHQGFTELEYE